MSVYFVVIDSVILNIIINILYIVYTPYILYIHISFLLSPRHQSISDNVNSHS